MLWTLDCSGLAVVGYMDSGVAILSFLVLNVFLHSHSSIWGCDHYSSRCGNFFLVFYSQ